MSTPAIDTALSAKLPEGEAGPVPVQKSELITGEEQEEEGQAGPVPIQRHELVIRDQQGAGTKEEEEEEEGQANLIFLPIATVQGTDTSAQGTDTASNYYFR